MKYSEMFNGITVIILVTTMAIFCFLNLNEIYSPARQHHAGSSIISM